MSTGTWSKVWLFLALLSWGLVGMPVRLLASAPPSCCCSSSCCEPEQSCQCGQGGGSADCAWQCQDPALPTALAPSGPAPTPEWQVLAIIQDLYGLLSTPVAAERAVGMPAGWLLPASPPLSPDLLNLPPPIRHLS